MFMCYNFIVFVIIFAAEFNAAVANSVFDFFFSNFAKDLRVESTCLTTLPIHHIHCVPCDKTRELELPFVTTIGVFYPPPG